MRKDQIEASKFKFGNMKKKADFLPTTLKSDAFEDFKSVDIGTDYIEAVGKVKLMAPDRAYNNSGKWKLQKTCDGNMFQKTARQEDDVYDMNYLQYMRTRERGMNKPTPLPSIFSGYSTVRN